MAYIFPNTPPTVLPPEVLRTFRFLKSLPDAYVIWHHLAPWQKEAPDFLILNPSRQALLVKVSGAAASDARPAAQMLLLDDRRPPLGEAERQVLRQFLCGLPPNPSGETAAHISTLVLFPNIPAQSLAASRPTDHPDDPAWLGQEALQPPGIADWIQAFRGSILDGAAIERLRTHFTPEVLVPAALTVRTPNPRRLEAGLTGYLLDYNQEAVLKADLELPQENLALTQDFRLNVVNGVAGSGKTLILLYRLRLLHGLYPDKRYLVLTHNRPLIRDMQARYRTLAGELPPNINWYTFNGWCYSHWPRSPGWTEPMSNKRRETLVAEVWGQYFKGTAITPHMLRSELDWFKDQTFTGQQDYLAAERRGRGFRLPPEQRERMAKAIDRYQSLLFERGLVDWGDVPRRMWEFIREAQVSPPVYDVVFVDEAQFFAPLWFDVVRRLIRPASGHLFVVADPTQGFLSRGASWKSLGLEARGHTHHLKRSYRTTREILNFAALFYRQRIPLEDAEEEVLAPDLFNLPDGVIPQIIPLGSGQDEVARIANEIEALAKQGFPLGQILVLHANWQGAELLIKAIQKRLGQTAAGDPKNRLPGDYVRVTTLNAGTGLESQIVFLAGLNRLFEEEQSLRLSDDEREQFIRENTRKVYMAATRAGQRLVLTYVGRQPDVLKKLLAASL